MAIETLWKLSTTSGPDRGRGEWTDGQRPWAPAVDARSRDRQINHYDYLAQIARAAELTGFDGLFIPDEADGEEPWIVTGALLRETRYLKLVTAVAPGSASAVYQGKMAASAQRFSGGRQAWFLDLDSDAAARRKTGDFALEEDLAPRARELVTLVNGIWGEGPYDQDGQHFVVEKGGLGGLVAHVERPELWIGGNAPGVDALSAEHADVHLLDALSIESARAEIGRLRASTGARQRRFGVQLSILAREEQADVDAELRRAPRPTGEIAGSYDAVAQALAEYADAGIDVLLLNAPDQIREVHIVGEQVLPRLHKLLSNTSARAAA